MPRSLLSRAGTFQSLCAGICVLTLIGAVGRCGTAVPCSCAFTRKPQDSSVTRGMWAAPWHQPEVGRCPDALHDVPRSRCFLLPCGLCPLCALSSCRNEITGVGGYVPACSPWCPLMGLLSRNCLSFLSPLKLSTPTPSVLTNCRSSLPFG